MVLLMFPLVALAQRVAVKTNVAHWATASPNLGAELVLGRKVTLDFGVAVNPFSFGETQTRAYLLSPEVRYWPGRPMAGHFVGVNASMGQYDLSWRGTNYNGDFFAAGLSYGYVFILGRRWNLETNIGVGWLRGRCKRWDDGGNAPSRPNVHRDLVAPTRIGVTLSYIIK